MSKRRSPRDERLVEVFRAAYENQALSASTLAKKIGLSPSTALKYLEPNEDGEYEWDWMKGDTREAIIGWLQKNRHLVPGDGSIPGVPD